MKKLITDLKENEGILCRTETEAKAICQLMHYAGLRWGSGESYDSKTCWGYFEEKEIIYVPKINQWRTPSQAENEKIKTFSASDFLTEKEIIGYKLVKKEFEKQALEIGIKDGLGWCGAERYDITAESKAKKWLKEAGVLDLWFEPVYKEPEFKVGDLVVVVEAWGTFEQGDILKITKLSESTGKKYVHVPCGSCYYSYVRHATPKEIEAYNSPKLPKINGYEGKREGKYLVYGDNCAKLPIAWFKVHKGNRHIKSMTLSSGVEINEQQMKAIRKYLAK